MNLSGPRFTGILSVRPTGFIFLLTVILLFGGLGRAPVYILDEARNAQAAREMLQRRDFIVPTFNGRLRAHKPPIHYYFMALAYSVFGVSAFAARFFSAVMGVLTIFVTGYFVRRYVNSRSALRTVAVLLASTHFLFEFRLAVPDPYLIFFVGSGIFCFFAYTRERAVGWLLLSALAAGLAVLAKGPMALLLPGCALAGWLLTTGQAKILFSWNILLFLSIVLVIALPWYIAVHLATQGAFTREFFLQHNIGRFEQAMEGHGGNFMMVPLFVVLGLLPFSVWLPETVRQRQLFGGHPLFVLAGWVTAVTIVFFGISGTKLPNYPMICYPFVALLIGQSLAQATTRRYPLLLLLAVALLLLAGAGLIIQTDPAVRMARHWAFIFIIPVIAAAMALWVSKRQGLQPALLVVFAGYLAFNVLGLGFTYPAIYRQNPVSKTLPLLKAKHIYAYKIYNPAYNFYLDSPVTMLHDEKALARLLAQKKNAIVLSRESELPSAGSVPFRVLAKEKDLFERPTTVVFTGR